MIKISHLTLVLRNHITIIGAAFNRLLPLATNNEKTATSSLAYYESPRH